MLPLSFKKRSYLKDLTKIVFTNLQNTTHYILTKGKSFYIYVTRKMLSSIVKELNSINNKHLGMPGGNQYSVELKSKFLGMLLLFRFRLKNCQRRPQSHKMINMFRFDFENVY